MPKIYMGADQLKKLYLGETQLKQVWLGDKLVYQNQSALQTFTIYDADGRDYRYGDPDLDGPLPYYTEPEATPAGKWYTYTNNEGYSTIIFTSLPTDYTAQGCKHVFQFQNNGQTYSSGQLQLNTTYTFNGTFKAIHKTSTNRVVNGSRGHGNYSTDITFYLE